MIFLNKIFPINPSIFKISISVESYDNKFSGNYQNYYIAEKRIVSKLLNKDCVKISLPYLLYFPRNKLSKSVADEMSWFIVLNYSASPKMVKIIYFNFF